jgi:hypothetical protein
MEIMTQKKPGRKPKPRPEPIEPDDVEPDDVEDDEEAQVEQDAQLWDGSDARRPRGSFTLRLPVRLSNDEALAKADALAHALAELDTLAANRNRLVASMNAERKALTERAHALRDAFVNRVERRPVACREDADWDKKKLRIYRLDSDPPALVDERDMDEVELQVALYFPGGPTDSASVAEVTAARPVA